MASSNSIVIQNAISRGGAVSLDNTTPDNSATVTASIDTSPNDPDGDIFTYSYTWLEMTPPPTSTVVQTLPSITNSIDLSQHTLTEGNYLRVEVTPNDGDDDGAMFSTDTSTDAVIQNTAPTIAAQQTYTDATNLHEFTVEATAGDADGVADITSCTIYHRLQGQTSWNGEPGNLVGGDCDYTIGTSNGYSVGDIVETYIQFADESDTIDTTVSSHTLPNQAPQIQASGVSIAENTPGILTATVTASDAESDQILYDYVWSVGGTTLPGGAIQDSTSNTNDLNWVIAGVLGGQTVRVDVGVEDAYDVGNTDNDSYQAANSPPTGGVVSLSHTQAPVTENPVTATVTTPATDPEGTNINYTYAWVFDADADWVQTTGDQTTLVTSNPTASITDAIDFNAYPAINKSGAVNVFVTAIDAGSLGGTPFSATAITIINSAPTAVSMGGTPSSNTHAIDFQGVAADDDGSTDLTSCALNHRLVGQTTYEIKVGALVGDTCTATIDLLDTYSGTNYTVGDNVEAYFTFEDSDSVPVDTSGSGSIQIPNQAPGATQLSIIPSPTATESDTLSILVESYTDPEGDNVNPTYQWYEQTAGAITGATSNTLANTYFVKGDQIYLEATPVDQYSGTGTPIQSNVVTIGNTLPVITSITVDPDPAYTTDTLLCNASATDADGDSIVSWEYEWDDGTGWATGAQTIASSSTTKGDSYQCRARASDDGTNYSTWATSSNTVTVQNSAPTIPVITLTASPTEFDDLVCNITTVSTDPDAGDSVQYNYTWYQNSAVYSTTGLTTSVSETITASTTAVTDTWICEVYATDGIDASSPASETRYISAGSSSSDPVIGMGYPIGGETLVGTVNLSAGVVDGDGTLNNQSVDFYYQKAGESTWTLIGSNNTFTGSLITGAVFNYSWDTTTVDRGINVTIRANVTDGFATDEDTSGSVFVDNRRIFIDGSTIDSTQYNSYISTTLVTLGSSTFDVDTDVLTTTVTTSNVDNSDVNASTLNTSTIIDSLLDNSQVTNCTVTNSTILDSTVQDSTITDAYINPSTIVNSTISGDSDVRNSTVTDSTITNQSEVHDSTVESSILDSTTVDNTSVVRNSQLTGVNATANSTVDDSVLSGGIELDGSTVTNTTLDGAYTFTNATVVDGIITSGTISDGTTTYDADLNGPTDVDDLFDYSPPPPVVMPLSIDDIDLDGKVSPGDELVVEIEVLNDYSEDLGRVKVRAEIESKSFDASDTDRISIDSGDSEKVEFVFEVPEDAEDDSYDLEVIVEATLDNGTAVRVEASESFLVERDEHAFWIKRAEVENLATCGSDAEISVVVKNVGNDDEDDVRVAVLNSQLPVLVNSDPFDLEIDDKRIKHVFFEVPENIADGAYQLVVKVYNDEASAYGTVDLVVSDCGPSAGGIAATAGDLASVQPMLEVPQDTMVRAVLTLTNTGSDVADYAFDLAGVASWAQTWSLEPGVVRLMPGDSVAMYLTAVPKQGYTGNQPVIVYLKGPNGVLLDTEVLNVHLIADNTVIASGQTTDAQTGATTITGTTTSGGGFSGLVRRLLWILS